MAKRYTHSNLRITWCIIWAALPDLCRRYNTAYSLPGASRCECLCSVSMHFSVLWRGSTLCCVLERRKKLFVAMPAFDTARFLPTFLRHLARVLLSFSKMLPHLLLCNGGLALFYSLNFNPTLSVSGKREIFAPFWFYGSMAVNADPILALPGL